MGCGGPTAPDPYHITCLLAWSILIVFFNFERIVLKTGVPQLNSVVYSAGFFLACPNHSFNGHASQQLDNEAVRWKKGVDGRTFHVNGDEFIYIHVFIMVSLDFIFCYFLSRSACHGA